MPTFRHSGKGASAKGTIEPRLTPLHAVNRDPLVCVDGRDP